jgi:hypothetical protein
MPVNRLPPSLLPEAADAPDDDAPADEGGGLFFFFFLLFPFLHTRLCPSFQSAV